MSDDQFIICIFPYVQIDQPLYIRGELLFPTSAIGDLQIPQEYQNHILQIEKFFYSYINKDNQNISEATWVLLEKGSDKKRRDKFRKHLEEIHEILGFICCLPDPTPERSIIYWNYEQVDYFVFQSISKVWKGFIHCIRVDIKNDQNEKYVEAYGYVNRGELRYITDGCRIYPQSQVVSRPFNLTESLERIYQPQQEKILLLFDEDSIGNEQEKRIFSALEWYNRSCNASNTIDLSLVYLTVAFEALLGIRRDKTSEREIISQKLITVIELLVGDTPRLASWFTQFYHARSRILHEGGWDKFQFLLSEDHKSEEMPIEYGSLTHRGLLIFRICFDAILGGQLNAAAMDLAARFFHHQERLERMQKILSDDIDPNDAIAAVIRDIERLERRSVEDSHFIKPENVWNVGKLLAEKVVILDSNLTDDHKTKLKNIIADLEPTHVQHSDEIIQFTLLSMKLAGNELPQNVNAEVIEQLTSQPPPSILQIKEWITQTINHGKNKNLSKVHRIRLQKIIELINQIVYRAKLQSIADLATFVGGDYITMYRMFSLIDGYSRFVMEVIENIDLNTIPHMLNDLERSFSTANQ